MIEANLNDKKLIVDISEFFERPLCQKISLTEMFEGPISDVKVSINIEKIKVK